MCGWEEWVSVCAQALCVITECLNTCFSEKQPPLRKSPNSTLLIEILYYVFQENFILPTHTRLSNFSLGHGAPTRGQSMFDLFLDGQTWNLKEYEAVISILYTILDFHDKL